MKATGGKYVPPHKRRTAMINPKPTNTNRERKREKKQSFGIVPCQTIEGKRCILLQISYSCTKYDFKVDPLRGNTKNGESEIKTAIREAKEESAQLLRFKEEDLSSVFQSGDRFYVHTQFVGGALMLPRLYSKNVPLLNEEQKKVLETEGLHWLDIDSVETEHEELFPRISDETERIIKTTKANWENIAGASTLLMYHDEEDGLHFYSSTQPETGEEKSMTDMMKALNFEGSEHPDALKERLDALKERLESSIWERRRKQVHDYPRDIEGMRRTLKGPTKLSDKDIRTNLNISSRAWDTKFRKQTPHWGRHTQKKSLPE